MTSNSNKKNSSFYLWAAVASTVAMAAGSMLVMYNKYKGLQKKLAHTQQTTEKITQKQITEKITQIHMPFYGNRKITIFYDANNSDADHYVWCVGRALAATDDQSRVASFASDMSKNNTTKELMRVFGFAILSLHGKELVEFIIGFNVPGVTITKNYNDEKLTAVQHSAADNAVGMKTIETGVYLDLRPPFDNRITESKDLIAKIGGDPNKIISSADLMIKGVKVLFTASKENADELRDIIAKSEYSSYLLNVGLGGMEQDSMKPKGSKPHP